MDTVLTQIRDQQRDTWDKFSAGWKKWDNLVLGWLSPVGEALLSAVSLRDGANVLDVAAGTGEPGLTAAERVPNGKVTATDLSERMLEVAAENAAVRGIRNFETRLCDAGDLPFADATFDAITCRFGFMFFPDVELAAGELARVLKPGGRIAASVWGPPDRNPWATTIIGTIASHVDMPAPPPGAPGLFRCAEPGYMTRAFEAVGLQDVSEREVSGTLEFESADQYWTFMTEIAAPVVAGLAKADDALREKIKDEVVGKTTVGPSDGQVRFGWSAVAVSAEK